VLLLLTTFCWRKTLLSLLLLLLRYTILLCLFPPPFFMNGPPFYLKLTSIRLSPPLSTPLTFLLFFFSDYCGFTGRCCCRPNHALKLHVYESFSNDDGAASNNNNNPTELMYMDRPCKCGQCCSVAPICQQEMMVYRGDLKADGGEPNSSNQIGYIQQPIGGGLLSPTLEVMEREGAQPFATIKAEAICCIGGMCCDHTFTVTDSSGNYMGKIVKERPAGLAQVAKELGTDADNFTLYVPKDMDPTKKANMLAALHLIDYWLFEDEGDFNCDAVNQKCECKICDMYCFGCVCPCKCKCGGNNGGSDSD